MPLKVLHGAMSKLYVGKIEVFGILVLYCKQFKGRTADMTKLSENEKQENGGNKNEQQREYAYYAFSE